jgi:hypothetical protein
MVSGTDRIHGRGPKRWEPASSQAMLARGSQDLVTCFGGQPSQRGMSKCWGGGKPGAVAGFAAW